MRSCDHVVSYMCIEGLMLADEPLVVNLVSITSSLSPKSFPASTLEVRYLI